MADITQDYLKSILRYNKATGLFTWRKRPREHFATKRGWNAWNARYAGTTAGGMAKGYILIKINYKLYKAHRLVWFYLHAVWPKDEIDHINGNKSDNRIINLREASRSENCRNLHAHKDNVVGLKGVCLKNKKWCAQITHNYKTIHLGYFDSPEKAHEAYCAAAKKYHGKFSKVA